MSEDIIPYVAVVGFDHAQGNVLDWIYPEAVCPEHEAWRNFAMLAMPEGLEQVQSELVHFCVGLPRATKNDDDAPSQMYYGTSCYRFLDSKALLNKSTDVTRSAVQKCVCLLARAPIWGWMREELESATEEYFQQCDFSKTDVLCELHRRMNAALLPSVAKLGLSPICDLGLDMIGELCELLGSGLLRIFRLLLLERRILICGASSLRASTAAIAIASLIPGLLVSWAKATCYNMELVKAMHRETPSANTRQLADNEMQLKRYGMPLALFDESRCLFRPYLPLELLEAVGKSLRQSVVPSASTTRGVDGGCSLQQDLPEVTILQPGLLAGTSSVWVLHHPPTWLDVLVDIDSGRITFVHSNADKESQLKPWEHLHMARLLKMLTERENFGVPAASAAVVRTEFSYYALCLLQNEAKELAARTAPKAATSSGGDGISASLAAYSVAWQQAWRVTPSYALWRSKYDESITADELLRPSEGLVGLSSLAFKTTMMGLNKGIAKGLPNRLLSDLGKGVSDLTSPETISKFLPRGIFGSTSPAAPTASEKASFRDRLNEMGFSDAMINEALANTSNDPTATVSWLLAEQERLTRPPVMNMDQFLK